MEGLFPSESDRDLAHAIGRLVFCNPFLEERLELEERILGDAFTAFFHVWHPRQDIADDNPNVVRIAERAEPLAVALRDGIRKGRRPTAEEAERYRELCYYVLFYRYSAQFFEMILDPVASDSGRKAPFWSRFRDDYRSFLGDPSMRPRDGMTPEHLFACFYQVRRAFHFTFRSIAGGSMPSARLRARVWQSVFTHDLRRYQRVLYRRMGEVTTLITGPSGAGKELVARAIGLSRYIPFDPSQGRFREAFEASFFPLNLPALSPTLIESELFGHRRGAFTGAVADRNGWLAECPPLGTVFLDELGEIDASIQVKLLRVLETRTFQPLGSTETRRFEGKIVAATNRDLDREIRSGRFRDDLYYRLCADIIEAPSLHERIADSKEELPSLLRVLAERLVGEEEAPRAADEAHAWISSHLGPDYPWPGNVRELSQCLSNVLIHRDYRPPSTGGPTDWRSQLVGELLDGRLTADEMLRRYCTLVYADSGSYIEAAERLALDRRTVKAKIDETRLAEIRGRVR